MQDSVSKTKLLEAKLLMLSAEIEKVKAQDETMKHNAIVAPDAMNMDEDRATMAIGKAKCELEEFYKNFNANCTTREFRNQFQLKIFIVSSS